MASNGKLALISGANKGIGFETARQLAQQGFSVLLGARDASKGEEAATKLRVEGLDVTAVKLDVEDQADIDALVKKIDTDYNGTLDVLINNAGVSLGFHKDEPSKADIANLRRVFETNLFAVANLTKALLPALEKSPAPRIVNLSSILGSITFAATPGSPVYDFKSFEYNSSKAALNMYTVHLAYEYKDNKKFKINAAHPGWVKTDMGGDSAPMEIVDGAKTSVLLATLGEDGPTGTFTHMGEPLPW